MNWLRLSAVLMQFTAMCFLMSAQEFRATVAGHVTDPSGARVPGATIEARNTETGVVTSGRTDSQGVYRIPFLPPGNYTLTAVAAGFKKYVREGLVLQVSQGAGVDMVLEVGTAGESVTVTAEAPLLDTETSGQGGLVDSRNMANLPMIGRTPFFLGGILPGVTFYLPQVWQRPFDASAGNLSINGGIFTRNEFLLDGTPNNGATNMTAYVPVADAVQEFKIESHSIDAQYGHTSGGVLNMMMKSGTNTLHATGWEYLRREWLDANTFQNKAVKAPKAVHYLDQYGFMIDGPVYLPKLYDGRNKTFFLVSFENYREGSPWPLTLSVPEPEFSQGDFSRLVNGVGQPITIYNPYSGRMVGSTWTRDPFQGNKIPQPMLSPIAQKIFTYFPKANASTAAAGYSQSNLVLPANFDTDAYHNLAWKFDHNFGTRHRAFLRHGTWVRTEMRSENGVSQGPGVSAQMPYLRFSNSYVLDWVSTLTPTFIFNVKASYTRFEQQSKTADNKGFDLTNLGFPTSQVGQVPGGKYFGTYSFTSYTTLGAYPTWDINNNFNLNPNFTKIWNKHSIHAGVDIRRLHFIFQNVGNAWAFSGGPGWTQKTYNLADGTSGNSLASFLIGGVSGSSTYSSFPFYRNWYVAPFFQDDWKISRRLTLNLGLRWDIYAGPDEKYNRLNSGFDPTVASPLASQINSAQFPGYASLKGGLGFAGVNGRPKKAMYTDWNNFQPRIGGAFQLSKKLVLRSGFSVFYSDPAAAGRRDTGFSTSTLLVNSLDNNMSLARPDLLSNPYPDGIKTPSGASLGPLTYVGQNFTWQNTSEIVQRMHQFSVGLQYMVSKQSVLDVSYVGSRGSQLTFNAPYNIPSLAFRKQCNILEGGSPAYCDALLPSPFKGIEAFRGTTFFSASTQTRFQLDRPFPQFSGDLTQAGLNGGRSWYNSLQTNYTFRAKAGLNLVVNYTYSAFINEGGYDDPYAKVVSRARSSQDIPHVFKLTPMYALPFGKGKRFGAGARGLVEKLIGGWELSNQFQLRSSVPVGLPSSVRILKDPRLTNGVDWNQYKVQGWSPCVLRMDNSGVITPMAYSVTAGCGTDWSGYSWLILPNYAPRETPARSGQMRFRRVLRWDATLHKTVQVTERLRGQLRIEVFNVLNRYNPPTGLSYNSTATNSNFGAVFPAQLGATTSGLPRVIQLAFKVFW